eukprot:487179-Prymnesium_polylepis.2
MQAALALVIIICISWKNDELGLDLAKQDLRAIGQGEFSRRSGSSIAAGPLTCRAPGVPLSPMAMRQ